MVRPRTVKDIKCDFSSRLCPPSRCTFSTDIKRFPSEEKTLFENPCRLLLDTQWKSPLSGRKKGKYTQTYFPVTQNTHGNVGWGRGLISNAMIKPFVLKRSMLSNKRDRIFTRLDMYKIKIFIKRRKRTVSNEGRQISKCLNTRVAISRNEFAKSVSPFAKHLLYENIITFFRVLRSVSETLGKCYLGRNRGTQVECVYSLTLEKKGASIFTVRGRKWLERNTEFSTEREEYRKRIFQTHCKSSGIPLSFYFNIYNRENFS